MRSNDCFVPYTISLSIVTQLKFKLYKGPGKKFRFIIWYNTIHNEPKISKPNTWKCISDDCWLRQEQRSLWLRTVEGQVAATATTTSSIGQGDPRLDEY